MMTSGAGRLDGVNRIIYDIGPYREQIESFRLELDDVQRRGVLAVRRIFELLPLNLVTPGGREALETRGEGLFVRTNETFVNDAGGAQQTVLFRDDELGEIGVTVPSTVAFKLTMSGTQSTLTSTASPIQLTTEDILPGVQISPPLSLNEISIGIETMLTTLRDQVGRIVYIDGRVQGVVSNRITDDAQADVSLRVFLKALTSSSELACANAIPDPDGTRYAVYRTQTGHQCTVQQTTSLPLLGEKISRDYSSRADAIAEMDHLYAIGECGPPHDR